MLPDPYEDEIPITSLFGDNVIVRFTDFDGHHEYFVVPAALAVAMVEYGEYLGRDVYSSRVFADGIDMRAWDMSR